MGIWITNIPRTTNTCWGMDNNSALCIEPTHISVEARVETTLVDAGQVIGAVFINETLRSLGDRGFKWRHSWWLWTSARDERITNVAWWAVAIRTVIVCCTYSHGSTWITGEANIPADASDTDLCGTAVLINHTLRAFSDWCLGNTDSFMDMGKAFRTGITWH